MKDLKRFKERFRSIRIIPYEAQYLEGTLEVARQIHARSIYAEMELDEEKLVRQLGASGGLAQDRYFRLAVRNGEVLGGFYGCYIRTFFSDQTIAKDMGWWVKETARGGAAAVLLLTDFEWWARTMGAKLAMIAQSGVENIDRTKRLFEHAGYRVTGYNTAKEL